MEFIKVRFAVDYHGRDATVNIVANLKMARKPRIAAPVGTRLPADWRSTVVPTWAVSAMLAKISPSEYETEAQDFEQSNVGVLSSDWREAWRAYCRRRLVERFNARMAPVVALFGD